MFTQTGGFLSLMKSLPANVNLETSTIRMTYCMYNSCYEMITYIETFSNSDTVAFFPFNITSPTCLFACLIDVVGTAKSP